MKVRELLKKKGQSFITIVASQGVDDAIDKMVARRVGAVLVEEHGEIVGVFTERDVLKCWAAGRRGQKIPIKDVMTRDLIVAQADDDMAYVMSIMTQKGVRHLPVVDKGKIISVLSIRDVVQAQVSSLEAEVHYLKDYITSAG